MGALSPPGDASPTSVRTWPPYTGQVNRFLRLAWPGFKSLSRLRNVETLVARPLAFSRLITRN